MALVLFAVGEIRIPPDDQCQIGIAERIFQKYATDNKLTITYWNYLCFFHVPRLMKVGTRYAFSGSKSML
jgi:hypothetical protein